MRGTLTHPIQRLTPELLSEIFSHCPLDDCLPTSHDSLGTSPLLWTKVCRFWREVAQSTPILWSSLQLNIRGHLNLQVIAQATSTWLSYSGALPITLTIICWYQGLPPIPLAEAIMPFSHRLITLRLRMPAPTLMSFSPALEHLPALERLELCICNGTMPFTFRLITAPKLISLLLFCTAFADYSVIPWQQLTHLDLDLRNLACCLEIIRLTPSLFSLSLRDIWRDPIPSLSSNDAIVSNIRSLSLRELSSGALAALFSRLTLPELSELSLFDNKYPWPRIEFTNLAYRSKFQIRKLTLKYVKCKRRNEFWVVAEGMKDLEELDLSFFDLLGYYTRRQQTYIIQCLTYQSSDTLVKRQLVETAALPPPPLLLPKLQVLTLDGVSNVHDGVLVDMIESRWKLGPHVEEVSRLRLVDLRQCRCWDAVEIQRLEEFCRQGLEVVVGGSRTLTAAGRGWQRLNALVEDSQSSVIVRVGSPFE